MEMAKNNKHFYVTTPIYYANDIPHIGHIYSSLAADILARWYLLKKYRVFFLTGTDEHGRKIEKAAERKNLSPKKFVDQLAPQFKNAWRKFNINYNRFIRTTDPDHIKTAEIILRKIYEKGDIYPGEYEGFYCTECEAYFSEKELEKGKCPIHQKKVIKLKEQTYFFKLSKYKNQILELLENDFIRPEFRKREIINRVKEKLEDISISRKNLKWGIPLPFDKSHVCYVWIEALLNYLSGIGYIKNKKHFQVFWPADVQIIGKDILWFHAVIWPALLFSVNIDLPKKIFAHGWWTLNKEKISKSRGNVVSADELINIAGVDAVRYYLFSETPFGQDGDFDKNSLINRYNNELADKFGNLISRTTALIEKYGLKQNPNPLIKELNIKTIEMNMENLDFHQALKKVFNFIDICNTYIDQKKPWLTKNKSILYHLAENIRLVTIILWPFIPKSCEKISKNFHFSISLDETKKPLKIKRIKKFEAIFKKIDNF